jgi:oligopeptide/dipeptide ABC transporter ATP-binding protein
VTAPLRVLRRPVVKALFHAPSSVAALLGIGAVAAVAILAPIFLSARAERIEVGATRFTSLAHPLGTDTLGRDLFARLLVATRLSLELGLAAAGIGLAFGLLLGVTAALGGTAVRAVLMRVIDALLAFPSILTAIFVSTIIGIGTRGALFGVGIALSFHIARLTSTLALSISGREYVNGARVLGVGRTRLMLRYILPNIVEPLIIAFSVTVSTSILALSALSFLGLGVQPPSYDWGRLLTEGVQSLYLTPAAALGPAVAIAVTALAVGLAGEAVARALNPLLWTEQGAGRKRRRASAAAALCTADVDAAIALASGELRSHGTAEKPLALQVENLVISYPRDGEQVPIVKGVSFDVPSGSVVGIVGESGSGKTMTALAVAQSTPYPGRVTGTIKLHGRELTALGRGERARFLAQELAVVFQDPTSSLNPALKIGSQMTATIRAYRKISRSAARALAVGRLREVHMSAPERQLKRYPHELSGGMRQRVSIGTGLMLEPSVLIADEPTTALDVTVQAGIMDLFAEVNASHRTTAVLLISHNLALVSQNCHRILVMYAGRIVEDLDVDHLSGSPLHPYTRALLGAVPVLGQPRSRSLTTIPGEAPEITSPPPGCPFHPRCPLAVERCQTELPPLLTRSEERGRRVACHVANADLVGAAS